MRSSEKESSRERRKVEYDGTYLGIVGFAGAEQRLHGVVTRDDEARDVDKELSGDVEENEEEVDSGKAEESIDFWYRRLFLEVVEHWIF